MEPDFYERYWSDIKLTHYTHNNSYTIMGSIYNMFSGRVLPETCSTRDQYKNVVKVNYN